MRTGSLRELRRLRGDAAIDRGRESGAWPQVVSVRAPNAVLGRLHYHLTLPTVRAPVPVLSRGGVRPQVPAAHAGVRGRGDEVLLRREATPLLDPLEVPDRGSLPHLPQTIPERQREGPGPRPCDGDVSSGNTSVVQYPAATYLQNPAVFPQLTWVRLAHCQPGTQ